MNQFKNLQKYFFDIFWFIFILFLGIKSYSQYQSMGLDFDLYYAVGELFKSGFPKAMYAKSEFGPYYAYSPLAAPFFSILTIFPWHLSKIIFFLSKLILYWSWPYLLGSTVDIPYGKSISDFSLSKNPPKSIYNPLSLFGILTCVLISPAVYEDFIVGNMHVIFITVLIILTYLLKLKMNWSAAFLLSFTLLFKPHYIIFVIPFLLISVIPAFVSGIVVVVLATIILNIFVDIKDIFNLFTIWLEIIKDPVAAPSDVNNIALVGLITRYFSIQSYTQAGDLKSIHLMTLPPEYIKYLLWSLKATVLIACSGVLYYISKSISDKIKPFKSLLYFTMISFMMLTLIPVVWMTYMTLLLLPIYYISLRFGFTWNFKYLLSYFLIFILLYLPGVFIQNDESLRILFRAFASPQVLTLLFIGIIARDVRRG